MITRVGMLNLTWRDRMENNVTEEKQNERFSQAMDVCGGDFIAMAQFMARVRRFGLKPLRFVSRIGCQLGNTSEKQLKIVSRSVQLERSSWWNPVVLGEST